MSAEQPPKSNPEQTEEELLAAFAASEERTKQAQEDMRRATEAAERLGGSGAGATPPPPGADSTGVPPPPMPPPPTTPPPPSQPTPPAQKTPEKVVVPETPEELDNKIARAQYFQQMNAKYPKNGTPEMDEFWKELERREEVYKATKRKVVESCLVKRDVGKIEAQEFLLKEVELTREQKLKNHFATNGERLMAGVSKGIEKWDNWGKAEGMKGYLQRLAKTGVSLAMIGAVSGLSVEGLAKMGIGTASALGAGLTSYLGRKVVLGTAISGIIAKVPDKGKKWVSATLMAGTIGVAVVGGSYLAAGGIVIASGLGLTLAQITKKYDKKIAGNMEKVKRGELNLDTLADDIGNMEREIETALKQAEKARILGKLKEGAIAIAGSMATLEVMGGIHNLADHKTEAGQTPTENHTKIEHAKLEQLHKAGLGNIKDYKEINENGTKVYVETLKDGAVAKIYPDGHYEFHLPNGELFEKGIIEKDEANILGIHVTATPPEATQTAPVNPPPAPETVTPPAPTTIPPAPEISHESSITFDHGKGAIQGILDLKHQLNEQYHGDFSNAPKSVQDFMHTDATKEAINLGLFDPSAADGKESALLGEGSVLGLDSHGNITLHDTLTGNDNVLVHGDTAQAEHYGGKMFHSGHTDAEAVHHDAEKPTEAPTPKPGTPASPATVSPAETPGTMPKPEPIPESKISPGFENLKINTSSFDPDTFFKNNPDVITKLGYNVNTNDPNAFHFFAQHFKITETPDHRINVAWEKASEIESMRTAPNPVEVARQQALNQYPGQQASPEILARAPVHTEDTFHLGAKITEVFNIYTKNLEHLLTDDNKIDFWKTYQNMPAHTMLSNTQHSENLNHIFTYLDKVHEITGLEPKVGILGVGDEKVGEYIEHALEFAASKSPEMLDKLKVE